MEKELRCELGPWTFVERCFVNSPPCDPMDRVLAKPSFDLKVAEAIISNAAVCKESFQWLRELVGLSRAFLGDRLGVDEQTVGRWETEDELHIPAWFVLAGFVADALGIKRPPMDTWLATRLLSERSKTIEIV